MKYFRITIRRYVFQTFIVILHSVLQTRAACETHGNKCCEALLNMHFTNLIQKHLEPKGCLVKTTEMAKQLLEGSDIKHIIFIKIQTKYLCVKWVRMRIESNRKSTLPCKGGFYCTIA